MRGWRLLVAASFLGAVSFLAAPVAASPAGFVNGSAEARAETLGLGIVTSGATLGYTLGVTLAQYRDNSAVAQGTAIDLGALPTLFGEAARCDEAIPLLPASALPVKTVADTVDADSSTSRRAQAFFPGLRGEPSTQSAGFQDAVASRAPQPTARANTETTNQDISFFSLVNPRSQATVSLTGQLRSARATVEADVLTILGGAIRFEHPLWEAVAMSGSSEVTAGRFTFDRAFVFGIERSAEQLNGDLQGFSDGISALLAGLGVKFDIPRVVIEGNRVRVTPMAFRLTDPPVGAAAIRPFFDQFQPLYDIAAESLVDQDCNNAQGLQLVDVVLQVLKGSGSIIIPVGGVEVSTDDRVFPSLAPPVVADPSPGLQALSPTTSPPTRTVPQSTASRRSAPRAVTGPGVASFDQVPLGDPVEVAGVNEIAPTTLASEDDTIDVPLPAVIAPTRTIKGTTGGTAAVIGLLGVGAALALAAADRFRMIRSARRLP